MNSWNNGDSGKVVKAIIDDNFDILDKRITNAIDARVKSFTASEWNLGTIFIPYSEYQKDNPCIELYIKNDSKYSLVYGGYEIRNDGIELQSDMAYAGKVVIR